MDITKNKFEAYVKVQKSGVTNMYNVGLVSSLSSLSREDIFDIMKNYGDYEKKFPGVVDKEYSSIVASN